MDAPLVRLAGNDRPFLADPAQSFTIPARYYFDPELFEQEKSAIFYRSWRYVGHASQLAGTGSYVSARIHERSVMIVRSRDGQIRGFYNVCRHRRHELVGPANAAGGP